VRAKRTLSESGLAYETPRGEELSERLSSVLAGNKRERDLLKRRAAQAADASKN
jgi:hypothetical protein